MNFSIKQHLIEKNDIRCHEIAILSEKKIDAFTLCQQNFCMKGVNLHEVRHNKNTFLLFK